MTEYILGQFLFCSEDIINLEDITKFSRNSNRPGMSVWLRNSPDSHYVYCNWKDVYELLKDYYGEEKLEL